VVGNDGLPDALVACVVRQLTRLNFAPPDFGMRVVGHSYVSELTVPLLFAPE